MQIHGSSHVHGPHGLQGPHSRQPNAARPDSGGTNKSDEVSFSPAAEAAAEAAESGQVRADMVARVRQQIAAGTYETPQKLDAAVDRLLDELS